MENKKHEPELTTITYDRSAIQEKTGNLYEAIVIMGKRSEQIQSELKTELNEKLDEFASHSDSLEEVFENREQIEVSKHYERLPKPTAIALAEFMNDQVYYRNPDIQA
ncbi:MAG: DNA-directed RNA polymerase subunit omega [Weeksellaceae bacterium]|nr:DNA-directed RNA polymerase subunit omega [Weeksellaceae bacterium]